jgi:hypothetical protein
MCIWFGLLFLLSTLWLSGSPPALWFVPP